MTTERLDSDNYRDIFLQDLPMMDTRAPLEFSKGSFPNTVSLPLMSDSERQRVGTCYKQKGQDAAIKLGHELVSGDIKQERIDGWVEFARSHPNGYLFCFRGGLRSQISQQWLAEAGINYPRITGGYKAMRTYLIEQLESTVRECRFVIVGGLTGCGKTEVLAQLNNAVDLEHHAHHRGSSFGRHATPQPSQIDFENRLSIDLLKRRATGQQQFVLEDESRLIGRCSLPLSLHQGMAHYSMVWLEDTFENRVERILVDYVVDLCAEFIAEYGVEEGSTAFAKALRQSLANIKKRLGQQRYSELDTVMAEALQQQVSNGGVGRHRDWIAPLLSDYYDPMYEHQRIQKVERNVFSGNQQEIVEYLQGHYSPES